MMSFTKIKDQITKNGKTKPLLSSNFKVKLHDTSVEKALNVNTVLKADTNDSNSGYLSGYMSTWNNSDSVGDIVRKGAFSKTLKERTPRVLWQHNPHEPIGVVKEAYEDERGLFAVIALNLDTQRGLETYNLYKSGAMDSFSIGIQLEKYAITESDYGSAYEIQEAKLWEVSAVTFPANEAAVVMSVKEHFEETIAKTTGAITDEVEKVETIEDMIELLETIRTKEQSELETFFVKNETPADPIEELADLLFKEE